MTIMMQHWYRLSPTFLENHATGCMLIFSNITDENKNETNNNNNN